MLLLLLLLLLHISNLSTYVVPGTSAAVSWTKLLDTLLDH